METLLGYDAMIRAMETDVETNDDELEDDDDIDGDVDDEEFEDSP